MATEPGAEREAAAATKNEDSNGYTSAEITVLRGLDPVRKRPGMYIGSTGPRGLHHLVYEVVDNSVDEALAGYCDKIRLTIHPDNAVTVTDNGRGIPVDEHPEEKKATAEVVLTVLHAGGKFGEGGGYKVSGGLHGVGVSVVNALSERLHLEIHRDGHKWTQDYERGVPQADLKRGDKIKGTGTTITFVPDSDVFETIEFDYQTLAERMRETAFLTRGLEISLVDERGAGEKDTFLYRGGIVDFVKHLNENKDSLHRKPVFFEQRDRGRPGRGRDAVELVLPGVGVLVREQHQHPRGRLAPVGLPLGADPDPERLRPQQGHPEGEGREPHGRRRPRGPDRGDLGEAAPTRSSRARRRPSSATRRSRASSRRPSTASSASSSRSTQPTPAGSSRSRSTPPAPVTRRARRAI